MALGVYASCPASAKGMAAACCLQVAARPYTRDDCSKPARLACVALEQMQLISLAWRHPWGI